jgi:hypothetical protein
VTSDTSIEGQAGQKTDGVVIREKKPGRASRKRETYNALQRDLILRLNHLKAEARESCEACLANIDSDVSTLVEFLDGSLEVRKPRDVKAGTMDAWMKTLDRTRVKPHKGRTKDLRRIERAIRSMMETAFE